MSTYDWPTKPHFVPASATPRVVDNTQRTAESSLSGYVQTSSMPGARWGWDLDFPHQMSALRDEVEAFLLRLSGRQHRVRLWDLKKPRPRGNIGLSGVTLGSSAVQFATSLVLAGCYPANNLFRYPAAFDNAAWSKVGGSITANTVTAPDGTLTGDILVENGAAGGHYVASSNVAFVAGLPYTVSAHMRAASGGRYGNIVLPASPFGGVNRGVVVDLATGAVVTNAGAVTAVVSDAGGGWWRAAVTATASSSSTTSVQLRMTTSTSFASSYTGDSASGICLWGAQCEVASQPSAYAGLATLLDNDWLALASGQLLRVVAPAVADAAGAMTVDVRHMLRAAANAGGAITLDKPTALYVRNESGILLPRQRGLSEPPLSAQLTEVFA